MFAVYHGSVDLSTLALNAAGRLKDLAPGNDWRRPLIFLKL